MSFQFQKNSMMAGDYSVRVSNACIVTYMTANFDRWSSPGSAGLTSNQTDVQGTGQ